MTSERLGCSCGASSWRKLGRPILENSASDAESTSDMVRIAILGANGQVGTELCLILRNHPQVELVPVCRNRRGSAFLRYHGVRCRHGLPDDPEQSSSLFGDCDIVVNSVVAANPNLFYRIDSHIIRNTLLNSKPDAKIIFFSTMMVYGQPYSASPLKWKDRYGRSKIKSERLLMTQGGRLHRRCFVFRLGHVIGHLQSFSRTIQRLIRSGPVILPNPDRPSNATHLASIADAILKVASGEVSPGVYDLMCMPPWGWQQVYQHEADVCGHPLSERLESSVPARRRRSIRPVSLFRPILNHPVAREVALGAINLFRPSMYDRLQAYWYAKQVASDVLALPDHEQKASIFPENILKYRKVGSSFLPSLTPTEELLKNPAFRAMGQIPEASWPEDLPLY